MTNSIQAGYGMPTKLKRKVGSLKIGESKKINFVKRSISIEEELDLFINKICGELINRSALINEALNKAKKQGIFEEIMYGLRRRTRFE